MYAGGPDTSSLPASRRGPWLVLDTSDAGPDRVTQQPSYHGRLVQRYDTLLLRSPGAWIRVGPDSLAFHEHFTWVTPTWRFRISGDSLHGTGTLVHDVGTRDEAGNFQPGISRWPVRIGAVRCADVPS